MAEAIRRLPAAPSDVMLSLGPVVGWRTWRVTPRLPAEPGPPIALRGQRGVAWLGPRQAGQCVDDRGTGWFIHRPDAPFDPQHGPVPAPSCRCGIYAYKPGAAAAPGPWDRTAAPLAYGWVELSGRVIEGSLGYRAEKAELTGPLEVAVRCAGRVSDVGRCDTPAVTVTRTDVTSFRGACQRADHQRAGLGVTMSVQDWLDIVRQVLATRYGTSVVTFHQNGEESSHEHR